MLELPREDGQSREPMIHVFVGTQSPSCVSVKKQSLRILQFLLTVK